MADGKRADDVVTRFRNAVALAEDLEATVPAVWTEECRAVLNALDAANQRAAELEAEFTGEIDWTIGVTDIDDTYYAGSYTEAGAKYHAARRQGDAFPAWRRDTTWHRAENSAEEAEYQALRDAAWNRSGGVAETQPGEA